MMNVWIFGRPALRRGRTFSVLGLGIALLAVFNAEGSAQERTSRLDRIFHGLEYRALPEGVAAYAPETLPPVAVAGGPAAESSDVSASPHNPDVLYRADESVSRSTDGGASWSTMSPVLGDFQMTVVAESPMEPGLVWAGGTGASLYLTRDGGLSWSSVTLPEELEGATVRLLVPSGYRGGTSYLVLDPPDGDAPGPLLFRTDDYGESWASVARPGTGFPEDETVAAFVEDPEGSELLFLGSEGGVYVSFDDGGSWDLFRLDMPQAAVSGLHIVDRDLVVTTREHGRFVLDEIGPLRQVMRGLLTGEPYLFEPSPAFTAGSLSSAGTRVGAVVDYLLPSFVRHVRLEVLDGEGGWVTTLRGEERPPPGERPAGTRAGIHRITWDLTYTDDSGTPRRAGPGTFTMRMTVDGLVRERTLEVLDAAQP